MTRPEIFEQVSRMPVPAADLYAWHARPGAFERLKPPWQRIEVLERTGGIRDGDRTVLRMRLAPLLWKRWVAVHHDHVEGRQFCDAQEHGPFASFRHTHTFEEAAGGASVLRDHIEYRAPGGALGRLFAGGRIRRDLTRAFAYRHRTTAGDLTAHAPWARRPRLQVLVTGSHGLLGSALAAYLSTGGHTVLRLVRGSARRAGEVGWQADEPLRTEGWPPLDAVVHLAGEPIAGRRWSAAQKERIRSSRVEVTRRLAAGLAALPRPPRCFVQASAVGFYGDRGAEELTEESHAGRGFLAEVGQGWEAAVEPLREAGTRVVALRLGMVLSPEGGALARLLTPFRLGLGGRIGPGTQWLSWVGLDDVLDVVLRALHDERLVGPVNAVAPEALTNREFARTLGRVLRRPSFVPLPAFAARLAFGGMAQELLLSSQRARPARLLALGHTFRTPTLEGALRHLLGRSTSRT